MEADTAEGRQQVVTGRTRPAHPHQTALIETDVDDLKRGIDIHNPPSPPIRPDLGV